MIFLIESGHLATGQISCQNNRNYTRTNGTSTYAANLNNTLTDLSTNVPDTGFYNASAGNGADRAAAMVLCRGDAQLDACRGCIAEGREELLRTCPSQRQAVRWDERCLLRYSDAAFYGDMETSPMRNWTNPFVAAEPEQFGDVLRRLLDRLIYEAAGGGSLRKVAAGDDRASAFQHIFAMVQCTPDLSREECASCLLNANVNVAVYCDRRKGCRVYSPSCTLRFEIYPFYNETRLQEFFPPAASPPSPPAPAPAPPSSSSPAAGKGDGDGDGDTTRNVIIIAVSVVLLSLILAVSAIIWLRKRKTQKPKQVLHQNEDEISMAESLQYPFSTIKAATNDFSDDNKLGEGGFGPVYKGMLQNGLEIAVKRLSKDSGQGVVEFKNEVLLLAKLQHRNLVRLLGFSIQGKEKLLIYEFVQNASLDHFIFDQRFRAHLDRDTRYKIIRDETQGNTSRIVGTYGYMPPEYILHGQFSIKSDVFSFGVLVLEIISGRRNNKFRNGENVEDLLSFAWRNWREGASANAVDPVLRSGSGSMSEMLRCMHIGLLCVQEDATERPTMAAVVIMLSSASISLAVPTEPAFYDPSGYTSRHDQSVSNLQRPASVVDHSDHSSSNDVSITDLHPR
ncbi:non-specific serine/threonine protein kinase [Salvia divinorum]|uniref:Non-specific serine/threonine protein kinase n=1 Tax=Salvia divinorum TaxID=28513 RepID=A0ABD1G0B0_SALDI